jgi:hypothetical protein
MWPCRGKLLRAAASLKKVREPRGGVHQNGAPDAVPLVGADALPEQPGDQRAPDFLVHRGLRSGNEATHGLSVGCEGCAIQDLNLEPAD